MIRVRRAIRGRTGGFTLVELLVVIGIIALLISILLPSLNRARESARRAYCLSNLHQVGIYLQMYSNQNKGAFPIGTWGGWGGNNYFLQITYPSLNFTTFGALVASGVIPEARTGDGKVLYCPSQTLHLYDDAETNHFWEFGPTNPRTVRTTYSQRPEFSTAPGAGEPWIFSHRWNYATNAYEPEPNGKFFPKIPRHLKGDSAILADLLVGDEHRISGHAQGVNVLYAHFGAQWIPLDMYRDEWRTHIAATPPVGTDPTRNTLNAVFKKLDAQ